MRRRNFLPLLLGLIGGWSTSSLAQQKQNPMPVIGCLNATSPQYAPVVAAFRQGLNETGYVEGQN
jgi:putative ABC transport system substrate-binding protein